MNFLGPHFVLNISTFSVALDSRWYEMSVFYPNHVSEYIRAT